MRRCMLGHEERTGEIDADAPVPLAQRELLDRSIVRPRYAGVVDERVEAAEAFHHLAYARADGRFLGNVATDEQHAARCLVFDVGDCDPIAALGEQPRDVSADALGATRYQGGFLRV